MKEIKSFSNEKIKMVKSLKAQKGRKENGLFMVEGKKLISEAIEYGYVLQMLFLRKSDDIGGRSGHFPDISESYVLEGELFDSVCDTKTPQGELGVFLLPMDKPDAASERIEGLVLALEDVQDPGNVGAVIRSADAFGASAVMLSMGCADIYSQKVLRSSMGSVFHMPVIRCADFSGSVMAQKQWGSKIIALHQDGEDIRGLSPGGDAILLVGNEGNGLSMEALDIADILCAVPMKGRAESLNAAVAASVALFML